MVARLINKLIAPLARRVRLLARRAVVRLVYDDPKMQELQLAIFSGEVRDQVERWEDYGFTSHPHPGAEAIVLALGGNTDHGAVIKVADRRYRFKVGAAGEVAVYDDLGQIVHLTRDGIVIDAGANLVTVVSAVKLRVEAPLLECTGEIKDNCDLAAGKTMSSMRTTYNGHKHNDPVSGQTSTPTAAM